MGFFGCPGDGDAATTSGRPKAADGRFLVHVGVHTAVPVPGVGVRSGSGAHEPDGGL